VVRLVRIAGQMKALRNTHVAAMVIGAVVLGAAINFVFHGKNGSSNAQPSPATSIVLADPVDSRPRHLDEPPVPGSAHASDVIASMTSGDRKKLTAAKEYLRQKVVGGTASDSETRQLRALCRELGDPSCSQ
jgi:hypothetical protein